MAPVRAGGVLLLLGCCFVLHIPPSAGQGSDCTCNMTNSRCDESGICRCDPGWGGEHCDRCVLMPGCVHGSCQQPWQCTCEPGWGGRFCDKDLSVCSSQQPCQNGATCTMKDNGDFTCLCPQGFHGRLCQRRSGPCHQSRSPCKNGGLCEDADGFAAELSCRCLAGFTGPRCETDIDDCRMKPCANNAVCLDGINRFSCVCPGGFTGRFCTVNLDDCASRPCLNGGRCLDLAGGFRCICQLGFMGNTCDTSLSSNWTTRGEKGKGKRSSNMTHHGNRLMKVTVSDRGGAGLSDVQLIVVVVLGAVTLAVVALTTGLVLWGRCRNCSSTPSWSRTRSQGAERSRRRGRSEAQQCQISVLNSEPQKKSNMEAV
ncbi:delta-like protein 2 [Oryzias melastigma]|uniref:Delta-like protein 2 n=1 Tax=Oryzias melastigma TaxID=30732 RepID=A0A834FGC0_ORYME|nr:delta-like protein 2 [Oryzias melastigma]